MTPKAYSTADSPPTLDDRFRPIAHEMNCPGSIGLEM
jgi:hypothetical protein